MAGLHFPITADNGSFMRAINEVTSGMRDASRQIESEGGNIDRVISTIKTGIATLGIGLGFKELSGQIFQTRAQFEQLEIAFTTMLGSAEKANALLAQLKQTAAKTPFEMEDVVGGAKSLLAYGIEAEKVNDTLIRLGDIASGLSIPLNDLTYLYGTTMVQGRMFTQDFRQFQGRGIPIADELAKVLGIAKDKVGEAVTAGKVGAKELEAAIQSMTNEGGRFGGLMAKQSDSLKGKWENIKDTIGLMFNEMGTQTSGVMNLTLDATASIVDHWQEVVGVLGTVAAAYGSQKAILMLDTAFTAAKNDFGYKAEIEQLQALIPVKEEAAKTDLEQAVASGKLTQSKADQIAALREEANAQLEALTAKETAAKAEAVAATEKLDSIKEEILGIEDLKQSLLEQYTAAINAGDAEKAQAIATDIASTETWLKEESSTAATIAEEAKAAATNAAAASEARETLATQINTAQTAGNSAATGILTIAKEKLALAGAKVNAVLKANQFAIVTGAVIALGFAIYKLISYQTDYQKATESANKAADSQMSSMHKEQSELNELKKRLESAKNGSDEWKVAKDQIVTQFGKYHSGLDEEIKKTGTLASSYDRLTESIRLSAAARAMDKYRTENDVSDDIDKTQEVIRKSLTERKLMKVDAKGNVIKNEKGGFEYIDGLAGPLLESIMQKVYESYDTGDLSSLTAKERAYLNQTGQLVKLDGARTLYQKTVGKVQTNKKGEVTVAQRYGTTVDKIDGRTTVVEGDTSKNLKEAYDKAAKDYKAAAKKVEEMKKNRSAYTEKQWEDAQTELKSAKEAYEKAGGETKTKKSSGSTPEQIESRQTDAHQKLLDLMKQQAEERLKLQQDYEYQQWQNRIDLMDEGEAKVIAQMELDQSKERASLEEQKKQAIQAEIARQKALFDAQQDELATGNKKYAKKVFNPDTDVKQDEIKVITDRFDALNTNLLSKQKKAEQDRLNAAQESFNSYLQEFGTYQQKREAIQADYDKRISEAANTGDSMMLEAQKNKALSDLDYQQWIGSEEIALAFGDISNLSNQTISQLISDMEKYREKVVATFDPDKIEKYEEALNKLRMADVENSFSAFGNMVPEYFTKRLAIQKQINDQAQIGLELVQKQNELNIRTDATKGAIKVQAKSAGYSISDKDLADPKKVQQIADKLGKSASSGDKLTSALHNALLELLKLNKEGADLEEATKSWDGNFSHLKETLASLDGEAKFQAITESVGSAAGLVGNLAGQASEMADALGAEGLGEAMSYLDEAMGSVQNIASGFAQGGLVGGIAAAAGEVMKWVTKLAMAGDARHQKNIEKLQERIDDLQKSYDKLGKSVDDAFSTDASAMIEQQNAMLRQQKVLIQQQMAEEEAKKKKDNDKIDEYKERLEEIDELLDENKDKAKEAIIGKDVKSAIDEFASLYAGAWEDGTDAAQASMKAVKSIISSALTELLKKNIQPAAERFYDALADAMADGILTDAELANLDIIKSQMDAMASFGEDQYKKIQERYKDLDELREELTDISFDSVSDNFKSLLSDMETTTEDFTDSFTEMLRNALVEGLMDSKYDALLKEWYAEFAKAMENHQLSDEERERLRQQYQSIVDQGIADRDAINSIVGGGAYSQQASSGSAWNMNQETGDELNGRFTAMVELEATNNTLVSAGNSLAASILSTLQAMAAASKTVAVSGDNETLLSIRDMMFLSTGHLDDIAKYTKHLQSMSDDITKMKEAIERI